MSGFIEILLKTFQKTFPLFTITLLILLLGSTVIFTRKKGKNQIRYVLVTIQGEYMAFFMLLSDLGHRKIVSI